MKKKSFFLGLLLILVIFVSGFMYFYPFDEGTLGVFSNLPDWIQGTLCIKTEGFLMSDEFRNTISGKDLLWRDDYLERQTYALFCDFANERLSCQNIPTDAVLFELHDSGCGAGLIFRAETGTHGEDCEYLGVPNAFVVSEYSVSEEKFDGKHLTEIYPTEAPMKILGIHADSNRIYYLKYSLSEDGDLEVQLVCAQDGMEFVYEHYPLSGNTISEAKPVGFSRWRYAISPDGKICWTDPYSWNLKTYNGESVVSVPDSFNVGSVCWADEKLYYFKKDSLRQLYVYDAETGKNQIFITPNGETIELSARLDVAMAVNKENNTLAVYSTNIWDEFGYDKLHFFSLDTGEQCDIIIDDGRSDQQLEDSLWRILPEDTGLNGYVYLESSYYCQSTNTKFDVALCWV